uniref:Uncharacterized protein n=1 Tax=Meloidogyne enterolobii TaxID=390850 RepID=A0A6V7V9M2_MELEN|nr:unnamed protein product [Meloidogyne enterolobii]
MNAEILSERYQPKINYDGFLYVFHTFNRDGTIKFWRCEFFGSKGIKCNGRIHTDLENNFLRQINIHSCPASAENVEAKKVVTSLKRRAVGTMETPSILRATTFENIPTPVLARLPNKDATKKIVKRVRQKEDAPPAMPMNVAQLQLPEDYQTYKRSEGREERFLLADSEVYEENNQMHRILIFGRESQGNWANDMKDIFADGTFIISPPLFQQVYAILSRRGDRWVFPVAYALLTSKSEATYTRMWELIKNVWPEFSPNSISTDYEMAAINSIRTCFPLCEIRCCLFHLVRNMKKKLSEFGLMQRYRNDPIFAAQSRWITSMAFLPIGDLTPAIIALDRNLMLELQPIMDWFVMNYTGRILHNGFRTVPMFVPELWNVYNRTLEGADRTNNFAESAHRKLQRAFSCSHPTLWKFIETLKREQKARDAEMALFIAGHNPPQKARYRAADERILALTATYQPVNIGDPFYFDLNQVFYEQPIIDFLSGLSHNYEMDP